MATAEFSKFAGILSAALSHREFKYLLELVDGNDRAAIAPFQILKSLAYCFRRMLRNDVKRKLWHAVLLRSDSRTAAPEELCPNTPGFLLPRLPCISGSPCLSSGQAHVPPSCLYLIIDLWAFRNLDDLESFIPLSWGLRSRKHKDAVRHQYTCWLWTHLLSLGVRRQEHFNFDFSIWYKILSCPTFFFILLHSMNFYNLFQSKDDLIDCTDPIIEWRYRLLFLCLYFFTCQFFFLPFKACLYINYVNFMYFFVPDVIWDYVISSNFAIIQRRFALKLNATDLQSMGPQRPQHNWATTQSNGLGDPWKSPNPFQGSAGSKLFS